MFLSTSFSQDVATRFAHEKSSHVSFAHSPTMFIFHCGDICTHVNLIKSSNPAEFEFLFPPYSVFTVRSTDFSAEMPVIHLDVSPDDWSEAENLPLSPWH